MNDVWGENDMNTSNLIMMMFKNAPIESLERLLKEENNGLNWGALLNMCYSEEIYERIGGDDGFKENAKVDWKRLDYLRRLISMLEQNGVEPNIDL